MNAFCLGIKQELALVFLVLLSFIPLMLMGFILDILLVHFFSMLNGNIGGLNAVSLWVYNHLAGYRFLSQELMAGFWFLMIISFIVIFSPPGDPLQLRFRFLFSFLFLWGAAISVAGGIAFACIKPFDLLLARVEDTTWVGNSLSTGLAAELAVILFLPIALFLWKKTRAARETAPSP
jgi:glucan phosphoethanolaminetransferase (alkaline phosphatase superfamily)